MPNPFEQGPYLSAAFLCEKVLTEQDGARSAIRIIDRVIRTVVHPSPPPEMEPFEYDMTLFLRFKSGYARGTHALEVQPVKPSGESLPPMRMSILFEGEEDRGVDSIGMIRIKFDLTGIYWFNVKLNDVIVTRIPFRVIYMPQIRQMSPGSGTPPQA
jgi:hypothetical protein